MPWQGLIQSAVPEPTQWRLEVAYYDDDIPENVTVRTIYLPLSSRRDDVKAEIRRVGADIKGYVVLSSERLTGQRISIP